MLSTVSKQIYFCFSVKKKKFKEGLYQFFFFMIIVGLAPRVYYSVSVKLQVALKVIWNLVSFFYMYTLTLCFVVPY